jgi:hypothetical protein
MPAKIEVNGWRPYAALVGSLAALAAIHTTVLVPSVLGSAQDQADERYVSRNEFVLLMRMIEGMQNQLDRIEAAQK